MFKLYVSSYRTIYSEDKAKLEQLQRDIATAQIEEITREQWNEETKPKKIEVK